ncbi:MAG TPA: alkaline phosphatase family protein [Candidatus Limnocylindrales bacterium]|nr:alkaline phosphatase family protein [Candidatus Limnocylindrales bacterium]
MSGSGGVSAVVPAFAHVWVIVLENHEYGSIVGNRSAPYLNSLIGRGALATSYEAVAHPSEPNYFALFAGSTFGVRDDGRYDLAGPNVADQLEAHGRTWRVYAQGLPGPCSTTTLAGSGVDLVGAPGTYARKHVPAISFTSISGNPSRCARITRLDPFDPAAANYELIVPNQVNDMHDGTVAQGDAFLAAFVPRITDSPAFANGLLVITFDEGTSDSGGGGRVATILLSPRIAPGTQTSTAHDHYSLLRTIENAWGLGCLAQSCGANDLREVFAP